MLFYLTNAALDVTMGAAWWIVKTTTYGLYSAGYYIMYGNEEEESEKEESSEEESSEEESSDEELSEEELSEEESSDEESSEEELSYEESSEEELSDVENLQSNLVTKQPTISSSVTIGEDNIEYSTILNTAYILPRLTWSRTLRMLPMVTGVSEMMFSGSRIN